MLKASCVPFGSWLALLLEGSWTGECLSLGAAAGMRAENGTSGRLQGLLTREYSSRVQGLSFHPGSPMLSSAMHAWGITERCADRSDEQEGL